MIFIVYKISFWLKSEKKELIVIGRIIEKKYILKNKESGY